MHITILVTFADGICRTICDGNMKGKMTVPTKDNTDHFAFFRIKGTLDDGRPLLLETEVAHKVVGESEH